MSAILLLGVIFALVVYILLWGFSTRVNRFAGKKDWAVLKTPPGPTGLPIIGNLHSLGKHESPFQAFTDLSKLWGDIFSLNLGGTKCVVVNNVELIREVLTKNGKFFGGRPDFMRFHKLFAGDRNNSLALCDWSNLQTRRRNLARRHCGPRQHTTNYESISTIASFECTELLTTLKEITRKANQTINIKRILMRSAMNMFSHYMCSIRFEDTDSEFNKIVDHFDEIFWEINQGYAVDFMPWLKPFYQTHMNKLASWSQDIRQFILSSIVEPREVGLDQAKAKDASETDPVPKTDFLHDLLLVLREDPSVDRNTIIFMLEDFLGGHSSVGNLVMLCLTAVARDPDVGRRIRREIESVTNGKRSVVLEDRPLLPYTEATILECLRYASSPIVPHVATENTVVGGYGIEKDTIMFINNYVLNTSNSYWYQPEKFNPMRFLENKVAKQTRRNSVCDSGMESDSEKHMERRRSVLDGEVLSVKKNIPHFLPFSIGKRTCIGQTLVMTMSFMMFANIMQNYDVRAENPEDLRQKPACVALPKDTYRLHIIPRK